MIVIIWYFLISKCPIVDSYWVNFWIRVMAVSIWVNISSNSSFNWCKVICWGVTWTWINYWTAIYKYFSFRITRWFWSQYDVSLLSYNIRPSINSVVWITATSNIIIDNVTAPWKVSVNSIVVTVTPKVNYWTAANYWF